MRNHAHNLATQDLFAIIIYIPLLTVLTFGYYVSLKWAELIYIANNK